MTLLRLFIFTALFSVVGSFASAQADKKWSTKQCSDLYKAIGFFTALADKQWKKKSEEKGGKTDAFVLCIFRHIGGYFGPALSSSSSS